MYCFECDSDTRALSGKCDICGKPLTADADRYFKNGMEALASGELGHAIDLLGSCVKTNPSHINGQYNLGMALALAGRNDDAQNAYMMVVTFDPEYPGIYTALGQISFANYLNYCEQAETQRQMMLRLFEKAINEDNDDVDAYYSLANAYIAIGSADKALPCLKHALEIQPESAAVHVSLARAFAMLEKYAEASTILDKSVMLSSPDDAFMDEIQYLKDELMKITLGELSEKVAE